MLRSLICCVCMRAYVIGVLLIVFYVVGSLYVFLAVLSVRCVFVVFVWFPFLVLVCLHVLCVV